MADVVFDTSAAGALDTIPGAVSATDTLGVKHMIHPETEIGVVVGLQAELNKIIKAISTSGGTITFTKNDGTTLTATIGTATTSADGLMTAADKTKLNGIETGAQKNTVTSVNGQTGAVTIQTGSNYTLPTASASTLGGVKVGTNLSISNGVLSATDTKYTLPAATSSVLGGVKVGSNITNSSGTISLSSANVVGALGFTPPKQDTVYSLPTASASTLGGVKVGTNLSISDGVLSATDTKYTLPAATSSVLGGVKVGSNITNSGGTISLTKSNVTNALGFTPSSIAGGVSGVKGSAESTYRTGQVNITAANIGLGNVDNTADNEKTVAKADQLTWGNYLKVKLDSEEAVNFNGSESVEIGVGNILPIAHGGTGNNKGYAYGIGSADNALYNSVNLDELKPPVADGYGHWSDFVCYALTGGSTNAPEGYSDGFLMMFYGTDISISGYIQLFFTNTAPYKVFMRRNKGNSTAKAWKQIST